MAPTEYSLQKWREDGRLRISLWHVCIIPCQFISISIACADVKDWRSGRVCDRLVQPYLDSIWWEAQRCSLAVLSSVLRCLVILPHHLGSVCCPTAMLGPCSEVCRRGELDQPPWVLLRSRDCQERLGRWFYTVRISRCSRQERYVHNARLVVRFLVQVSDHDVVNAFHLQLRLIYIVDALAHLI